MEGEAAKKVQDSSSEENKVEEVSCIVKFRPCKDWTGEYGFDWVREGKEDFEEKISVKKSIHLPGAGSNSYVGYIPKEIAIKMLKKQWGEEKYEEWRKEKRKTYFNPKVANPSYIDENGELIVQDEKTKESIETYVDGLASAEIRNDPKLYDETAWLSDNKIKVEYNIEEIDDGVQPIEYVYSPKRVVCVKYYLNSKDLLGVLRSKVAVVDPNGADEAEQASYELHHVINTPSTNLSLLKKDDGYVLPYYTENENQVAIKTGENIEVYEVIPNEIKYKFLESFPDSGPEFVSKAIQYCFDDRYKQYQDDKKLNISCKKIECVMNEDRMELAYWHFNGKKYLWAKLSKKNFGGIFHICFRDGNPVSINQGGWKRWFDLEAEERSRIKEKTDAYFTEGILLDRDLKDLEAIMGKVKNKEIDDVVLTIFNPHSLKEYNIPENELTKDSLDRDYWNGNRIISWQEQYEDSFSQLNIRLKKKKEKKGKENEPKYCVPELSISHEDIKRTRFKFNTSVDAPVKSTEPKNEYKLQLRYEGDCDELRFETDQPDSIVIQPKVIENPKDKDTITVKYTGNYVPIAKINVIGVKKYLIKDTEKLAGQLKVRVHLPKVFKVLSVKVSIGGHGLSKKFEDCIEDQFDSLNNVFSQVGIKTEIMNTHVDIDETLFNGFLVNGKMDDCKTVWYTKKKREDEENEEKIEVELGDAVLVALEEQYGKDIALLLMQYVVFIFIDKGFYDNTSAYQWHSNIYHCKYEVFGQSSSFKRARVGVFAHESLHALMTSHVFQFQFEGLRSNPFCFPIKHTSNIMDYSMVLYSLHKYQWDIIEEEYPKYIRQSQSNLIAYAMNNEAIKKELRLEKRNKQKRDRLFSKKMDEISKSSSLNKRN